MIFPSFLSRPERVGGDIAYDLIEDADVKMRVRSVLVRPRVDLANVLQLRVVDCERALRPLRRHRDVRPIRHQLLVPKVPGHLVGEIERGYIMLMLASKFSRIIILPYISLSRFLTLTYMEATQETNYLNAMVNFLLS